MFFKSIRVFFYLYSLVFYFASPEGLTAQERQIGFEAYNFIYLSAKDTPFWLHSNRHGAIDPGSTLNHLTGFTLDVPIQNLFREVDITIGGEAIRRHSNRRNTLHVQQLYGKAVYRFLKFRVGRFHEILEIYHSDLTSGSMILSQNATPFPKISLGTNGFTNLPLAGGRIQFHARYSEGFLEEERFTRSPMIHQKSAYLKLNIENFEVIGGILHNVIWGGESPRYGHLPRSLSDYLRVVFSQPASEESGAPGADNRLGNSVGAYDFTAVYTWNNLQFRAYRLFFLEDTPSVRFRSPRDGVWGAVFERKDGNRILNSLLYEHIYTITQDAKDHIPKGRANYYNHGVYRSGWSYYGNTLGNPLLTFDRDEGRFINNMVIAHHLGIAGQLSDRLGYRFMTTYSRNYGICNDRISPGRCTSVTTENPMPDEWDLQPRSEFRQDRHSTLLEARYLFSPEHGISLHGSLTFDLGEYYAPRAGFMAGISWNNL